MCTVTVTIFWPNHYFWSRRFADLMVPRPSDKDSLEIFLQLFLQTVAKTKISSSIAVSSTTTDLDDLRFWSCLKSFQHSLCSCVTKWPIELRTAPIRVWWTLPLWRCHGWELPCKTCQLRAIWRAITRGLHASHMNFFVFF